MRESGSQKLSYCNDSTFHWHCRPVSTVVLITTALTARALAAVFSGKSVGISINSELESHRQIGWCIGHWTKKWVRLRQTCCLMKQRQQKRSKAQKFAQGLAQKAEDRNVKTVRRVCSWLWSWYWCSHFQKRQIFSCLISKHFQHSCPIYLTILTPDFSGDCQSSKLL